MLNYKQVVMRLGRIILASLTALAAYSYAQARIDLPRPVASDSMPRLLHAVLPLLACAAESISPAHAETSSQQASFPLSALNATPLGGSLCLVASVLAVNLLARRHQCTLLRC